MGVEWKMTFQSYWPEYKIILLKQNDLKREISWWKFITTAVTRLSIFCHQK